MERHTLIGIGSLMSIDSARSSFDVANFRRAKVCGWERVFNLVSIASLKNGKANPGTHELAAVAARRAADPDAEMTVSVFDITSEDLATYYARENRYRHVEVAYEDDDGVGGQGLLCEENTDAAYKAVACKGDPAVYHDVVGRHWGGRLWYRWDAEPGGPPPHGLSPPTIYPVRPYLALCRAGAASIGAHESFMQSRLADGRTVGEYLAAYPDREAETRPGVAVDCASAHKKGM
eukprot:TRINITY_DN5367_c0_g2_i2.p2 TRINITY_DN5367_c0_g2~~TRINITY_DN5367_c0_g2_i2.p2  ORF type:complete len:234 (+),score=56.70 TRINITY_DN5367_c0_g2_i2:821-1522(+)